MGEISTAMDIIFWDWWPDCPLPRHPYWNPALMICLLYWFVVPLVVLNSWQNFSLDMLVNLDAENRKRALGEC